MINLFHNRNWSGSDTLHQNCLKVQFLNELGEWEGALQFSEKNINRNKECGFGIPPPPVVVKDHTLTSFLFNHSLSPLNVILSLSTLCTLSLALKLAVYSARAKTAAKTSLNLHLNLSQIKFTEMKFTEMKFTEMKFTEMKFTEIKFTENQFSEIKFTEVKFTEIKLT